MVRFIMPELELGTMVEVSLDATIAKIRQSLLAAHIASKTDQKPQEESPPVLQGSSTRVKSELAQDIRSQSLWSKITVTHNRDSIEL